MRLLTVGLLGTALLSAICSAKPAPSARHVLRESLRLAKKTHKNVFVDFGASWCPWCRRLETLLDKSQFSSKFHASYVIAHITVRERSSWVALNNRGWKSIMKQYRHVRDQDIPYVVILNANGRFLGDSYEKRGKRIPENAAYPQTRAEITACLDLLKKTGSRFTSEDLSDLKAYFNKKA